MLSCAFMLFPESWKPKEADNKIFWQQVNSDVKPRCSYWCWFNSEDTKTVVKIIKCKHQLLLPLIHFNKERKPPVTRSNSSQLKFKGNRFSLFSVLGMFCSFPEMLSITGCFAGEENYKCQKIFNTLGRKPNKKSIPHLKRFLFAYPGAYAGRIFGALCFSPMQVLGSADGCY